MNVLILGQSNGENWSDPLECQSNIDPSRGAGEVAFSQAFGATVINAAVNGSGLTPCKAVNWTTGGLYEAMLESVGNTPIDAVIWIQGEADAGKGVSSAEYQAALGDLFTRLRADFGDIPVYLQPLVLRPEMSTEILAAQIAYCESDPLATLVEAPLDLGSVGTVHFNSAGYAVWGEAFAAAMGGLPAPAYGATGTTGHDLLYGDSGDDFVVGRDGRDLMGGGSGNDTLHGGARKDAIFGDIGTDFLRGSRGADTLDGGPGRDVMTGDAGRDVFFVEGGDRVRDFSTGDTISVPAYEASYIDGRLYSEGTLLAVLVGAPELAAGDLIFW